MLPSSVLSGFCLEMCYVLHALLKTQQPEREHPAGRVPECCHIQSLKRGLGSSRALLGIC